MKTKWSVTISVESEHDLTLGDLWFDPADRPDKPTVEDVKRALFGSLSPSTTRVTDELRDMGMLDFGIEDVKISIFQPIELCDECQRPLGTNMLGHKSGCSLGPKKEVTP